MSHYKRVAQVTTDICEAFGETNSNSELTAASYKIMVVTKFQPGHWLFGPSTTEERTLSM